MLAWRRFLVETVLCIVLIAVIVMIALRGSGNPLTGVGLAALVASITRIIWRAR
jgi:hypothetical protein